jgi:hypothetical protein
LLNVADTLACREMGTFECRRARCRDDF